MKRAIVIGICWVAILLVSVQTARADVAYPHPVDYVLPDGTRLTIQLKGDEFVNWAVTTDGYTLLMNGDDFYEYAISDASGDLVLSGIRAHNAAERTATENAFLRDTPKHARYSKSQIDILKDLRGWADINLRNASAVHPPSTGEIHAPLILVDFPDTVFSKSKEDFEMLVNQVGCTLGGTPGSVRDYFYANSRGKLDFTVDVFGPYRMPLGIKYYDYNSAGIPRNMAKLAVQMAHEDGCNFADYDIDGDGNVDAVHIIFAGYSQSSGGKKGGSIWPHSGQFDATFGATGLDGKKFRKYSCSAELRGTSGKNITYIGSIAHELGHVFGLPDFYDVDDSNYTDEALGLGTWDIMASGSHNDGGRTPANHSAWALDYLEWVPAIELSSPEEITLPHPDSAKVIYRINTQTINEYFLLENRQQTGWDKYIPAEGLLIYHVDRNYGGWTNNTVNDNPAHRGNYVKQAGGGATSIVSDRKKDPYPYGGNTEFTDTSVPNALSWAGAETGKPVTNITHNTAEGTVSFSFMEGMENVKISNPNKSRIFFQQGIWYAFNGKGQAETISMYDIAGRKIFTASLRSGEQIALNEKCAQGIYIVEFSNIVAKIIII